MLYKIPVMVADGDGNRIQPVEYQKGRKEDKKSPGLVGTPPGPGRMLTPLKNISRVMH
jgi:hypothetical protein